LGTGRSLSADTLDAHPDSVAAALEVLRRRVPAGLGP
jgi:hypothetical protein